MADNVIGDAVIEVGADGAKFRGDLEGLEAGAPGLGTRISGAIGKTLKAGVIAVGAVAGATLAKTLFGGFNRLANIDQATKKLEGLGHEGKALETIMDNALASVKGTAFGLDEAATVAANLVAAGIQPGSQLEEGLRLVANTASVAGVSMAEVGDIFTEVAAGGKVTGDTLARLQARGIPALQLLADQLGVTREAAASMVRSGQVDFDTFSTAINESMGEAALIAGESFRGMLANIGAAMNRLGAVALTPAFEGVKSIMPNVIALFDRAATALQPLVDKIAPQVHDFFDWLGVVIDNITFDGLGERIDTLPEMFERVSGQTEDILKLLFTSLPNIMVNLIPKIADAIASKVHMLLTTLTVIVNALVEAMSTAIPELVWRFANLMPMMIEQIDTLLPQLVNAFVRLLQAIVAIIPIIAPALIEAFTTLLQAVVDLLPALLPALLNGALTLFTALVQAVVTIVPILLKTILAILPDILSTLIGMIPSILKAGIELFQMIVQAVIDIVPALIKAIIDLLPQIVESVLSMLPELIDTAVELFLALVEGVFLIAPVLLDAIFDLLPSLVHSILKMLPQIIDAAFRLFNGLILGLIKMLPMLITSIIEQAPRLVAAIIKMLPDIIMAAIDLFIGLVKGLIEFTPQLLKALWELGPQMVKSILSLVGQLRSAGKDLIKGLIKGIGDMAGAAVQKAKDLANGVLDKVKGFFGINSPSKVFAGVGESLGEGLIDGVDKMTKPIERAVVDMVKDVPDVATVNIKRNLLPVSNSDIPVPGISDAALQAKIMAASQVQTAAAPAVYQIGINVSMDDLSQLKSFEDFMEMLQVYARMGTEGSDD